MSSDAARAGRSKGAASDRKVRTPPRPVGEVVRDLERERDGLVEAVDTLRVEATATRARVLSPRVFAMVGGALITLIALRRRRKRR